MRPPRVATLLLSLALDRGDRSYALSDLAEEYAERAARQGRTEARRWYWAQVRGSIGPSLGRRLLRPRRLALPPVIDLAGVESLWQDARFAVKTFARAPGFTLVATMTVALGIGANVATFSLVNGTLLRPLPFRDADRLVALWAKGEQMGAQITISPTPEMLKAWLESAESFDGLVLYRETETTYTGGDEPEVLGTAAVSPGLMTVLGVVPRMGREFTLEDTLAGSQPTALISEPYWRLRFGSDPDVIGRSISLDGSPHLVVGIVPEQLERLFAAPFFVAGRKQLWLPLTLGPTDSWEDTPSVLARLAPGRSANEALAELEVIQAHMIEAGITDDQWRPAVLRTSDMVSHRLRTTLLILLAAVLFVLLITCANVANMLISRGMARTHEFAIRTALGAGRLRVARQLLSEGMVLSVMGGAIGILLAVWGVDLVSGVAATDLRELKAARIEPTVLVFAVAVTLLTGLVFSFAPAVALRHVGITGALSRGGRREATTGASALVRQVLVAVQVAIALVLFLGAGLLLNSFVRLNAVDPGFEPANLIAVDLTLPDTRYPDRLQRMRFFEEVADRMRRMPGAGSIAWSRYVPPDVGWLFGTIVIEGRETEATNESPLLAGNYVSLDYFRTLGATLREGTAFTPRHDRGEVRPVIVNQTLAQAFWPDGEALGQRLRLQSPFGEQFDADSVARWRTIVGVVGNMQVFGLSDDPNRLQLYYPFGDRDALQGTLLVRATGDPTDVVPLLKQQVWAVDPDLPINRVALVDRLFTDNIARPRFNALLLTSFAALALFLAAIGVYGVISLSVSQRTREIGLRVALGAQRGDIVRLMMGSGARPAVIGMAVGVVVAWGLVRFLESLLFQIQPTDLATHAMVILLLGVAGMLACYVPARRAMSVDPVEALRQE
jgi:putative ABC transport system permease protein